MNNVTELSKLTALAAARAGVKKFDVFGSSADGLTVKVRDGKTDQVSGSERASLIVRVWNHEGRVGVATSTDLSAAGLESALSIARDAAAFGSTEHIADFSPLAKLPLSTKVTKPLASTPSLKEMVHALCEAEKTILGGHAAITSVPYNGTGFRSHSRFYFNSEGALRHEEKTTAYAYLYSRTEQEGRKNRSAGDSVVANSFAALPIKEAADRVVQKTISHLDYRKVKSGKYPIVFSPKAFLELVSAFDTLFNAQRILDKQSLGNAEMLGQPIASPLVTLSDDPLHPGNVGKSLFDSEGTPTRKVTLIEKGVLKSFLHSAGSAKRFQVEPTGNASIGSKVGVVAHYYHVEGMSAKSKRDIKTEENPIVYIDELNAIHAGVNALEGSFSLPFDGWLVENGKFQSIESATVAGDFLTTLKSICYVSPEATVTPEGVSPEVWVDSLAIAGEG